jgi:hypothetical protein
MVASLPPDLRYRDDEYRNGRQRHDYVRSNLNGQRAHLGVDHPQIDGIIGSYQNGLPSRSELFSHDIDETLCLGR